MRYDLELVEIILPFTRGFDINLVVPVEYLLEYLEHISNLNSQPHSLFINIIKSNFYLISTIIFSWANSI